MQQKETKGQYTSTSPLALRGDLLHRSNMRQAEQVLAHHIQARGRTGFGTLIELRPTDESVLRRIAPEALIRDASMWLVLYQQDQPEQPLILSLSIDAAEQSDEARKTQANSLLDIGLHHSNSPWLSHERLEDLRGYTRRRHDPALNGFALLHLSRPFLDEFAQNDSHTIGSASTSPTRRIREGLIEATLIVTQARSSALAAVLQAEDGEEVTAIMERFDRDMLHRSCREASRIAGGAISSYPLSPEVEALCAQYAHVMHKDTMLFLKSSDIVYAGVSQTGLGLPEFDFALPGCGLWKAIELEANLTVIALARYAHGLMTVNRLKSDSLVRDHSKGNAEVWAAYWERHPKKGSVNLNWKKQKDDRQFAMLTLGQIKAVLEQREANLLRRYIDLVLESERQLLDYTHNSLAGVLDGVSELRNNGAHVQPMEAAKFWQLRDYIVKSYRPTTIIQTYEPTALSCILTIKDRIRTFDFNQSSAP